jgi:hypothetical protein
MTPLETILMEKVSQTPHDAVFRQMLMHQAVAKDFCSCISRAVSGDLRTGFAAAGLR